MTSSFLTKSQVLVSSWTPLSPLMRTSRLFARHVTFILDLSDTLGTHSQLTSMTVSIAVAVVQLRLDYCNSLLYGIPAFNINKLQRVQNLAAKIALNDWHSPSQELISQLHWLPVHSRIKFKISSLTFKLLAENQPAPSITYYTYMFLHVCWGHQPPTRTSIDNYYSQFFRAFWMCMAIVDWNNSASFLGSPLLSSPSPQIKLDGPSQ